MTKISETVAAKSDQLNADDLMGGPIVIKITRVRVGSKSDDQPVVINYEDDGGKPYKPNKGMRRVLISIWGDNADDYVGRSLGLYRNPKVKWAGDEVGGIQIGAASHIDQQMKIMIQVKKGQKAGHIVKVLGNQQQRRADPPPAERQQRQDDGGFDQP